jgi:hypothetical protein
MQYTKIVKLASGNVQLQNASDSPVKTLQPAANLELLPDDAGVRIKQWQGENTDILISQVAFTRLDPAADVAFAGTAQDLMTLLSASFFFELVASAFPDYPVGSYQTFANGYVLSTTNITINLVYGLIVDVKKSVTLDSISIQVMVAVAGNAVGGIYQYTDNGTPEGLWFLVEQTDSAAPFDLGVASTQNVLLTNSVTLESGIYCFALHGNSTAQIRANGLGSDITFAGYTSNLFTTSFRNRFNFNRGLYSAVLPASIAPVLDNGSTVPLLAAKVI